MAWLDVLVCLPVIYDFLVPADQRLPNLIWLCFPRKFEVMMQSRTGQGFDAFRVVMSESLRFFVAAMFLGVGLWLTSSALLFALQKQDQANVDLLFETGETKLVWGDDPGFVRFSSLPSTMYYTLINLQGEFPLASKHTGDVPWPRLVLMFLAVVGYAVMALPCGLLGSSFRVFLQQNLKEGERKSVTARLVPREAEIERRAVGNPGPAKVVKFLRGPVYAVILGVL